MFKTKINLIKLHKSLDNKSLSGIMNEQSTSIYNDLVDCFMNSDLYDFIKDYEKRLDKVERYIKRMTLKNTIDYVNNVYSMATEHFYNKVSDEIENIENSKYFDNDAEDYQMLLKLYKDYPEVYIVLTDKQLAKLKQENGCYLVNGYHYIHIDTL